MRAFIINQALAFMVALSVFFAPLAPVFAMVAGGDAHAVHATQDGDHRAHGSVQADHGSRTCTQHDSCVGQCCACCAHCVSAVFLAPPVPVHALPVQMPVSSQLHSFVLIASPDRPPRLFSL